MGSDMNVIAFPIERVDYRPKLYTELRLYEFTVRRHAPQRGEGVLLPPSPLALFVASFAFGLALWWGR